LQQARKDAADANFKRIKAEDETKKAYQEFQQNKQTFEIDDNKATHTFEKPQKTHKFVKVSSRSTAESNLSTTKKRGTLLRNTRSLSSETGMDLRRPTTPTFASVTPERPHSPTLISLQQNARRSQQQPKEKEITNASTNRERGRVATPELSVLRAPINTGPNNNAFNSEWNSTNIPQDVSYSDYGTGNQAVRGGQSNSIDLSTTKTPLLGKPKETNKCCSCCQSCIIL